MEQANICIRMDKELKEQFINLCDKLGFTMSTAINIFVKAVVRTKGIPFALSIDDYNEETRKTIEDIENGIGLVGPFHSTEELMQSLLSEDEDEEE